MTKEEIISFLTMFKALGFEVIKSNCGQIALNNKQGTQPLVLNNDIGYLTPSPCNWSLIDEEIKRLTREVLKNESKNN